jgi:outer membrane biosynthesis protein TonB
MDRGSIRFLLSALGCTVIAAAAAHPGFAQRPNPAPDPAPAAPAPSSEPTPQPTEPSSTPRKSKKAVPARAPKAEKPDRPEKKKQKVAPAAKRREAASPARTHQPDPGHAPVLAAAAQPTAAAVRSEGDTVPFSTKARVLLVGTVLLTLLLLAAAVAPRRLLVRLSVDGLQERRADLAFAGLCVLTVGSLLGTLVAISG